MVRRTVVLLLAGVLALLPLQGCNGLSDATKAQNVITAVLTIAKAEVALIPPQDQAAYTNFVNLGLTLDTQLGSCITGVTGMIGTGSKFAACFNAFALGLTSPTELAQLRILSSSTQGKVQLYVTSIIAGINVALAIWGKPAVTPPAISPNPVSSSDVLKLMSPILAREGINESSVNRAIGQ